MSERFYTVDPIDVEGDGFTLEGLQSVLDKIRDTWGGKAHKPNAVSPALSLGNGATIVCVESGRVMLIRDDAARELAKRRAAQDEVDGRTRTYHATLTIGRVIGTANQAAEEVATAQISGEGLMGLLFNAAMFVQDTLGDVPACMQYEECERREKSMRAQLSRARGQDREVTGLHFPSSDVAGFFELGSRPNEYYRVVLGLFVNGVPAAQAQTEFPELPRRT